VAQLSLKGIQRRIRALMKQAEKLKTRNKAPALRRVVRLMRQHELSLDEVGAALRGGRKRRGMRKSPAKAKRRRARVMYRNPKTGETWSGRGRPARWVAEAEKAGRSRNEFLVKPRAGKR
jgi:DNA-binding protein H-NS